MSAAASRGKVQGRSATGKRSRMTALASPTARFRVLVAFLALILLMGGGSRADINSLVLLRPLAFLMLGYAVFVVDAGAMNKVRVPLLFLCGLVLLIGIHLIPLPPSIWGELPGRDTFTQVYEAAGIHPPWLPLTPTPARGWNSIFALSVPLAVLLLFAAQDEQHRRRLFLVIWVGAFASLLLGVMQLAGAADGPLYLYRITNNGLPVGFLANRNHQGLLISIGILLSAALLARSVGRRRASPLAITAYSGAALLFLLFLLIVGSRAGLVIGTAMLFPAGFMIFRTLQAKRKPGEPSLWRDRRFRWSVGAGIVAVLAVFISSYVLSRSLAFDRLVGKEFGGDLRAAVLPVIIEMIRSSFPLGAGFGSFEAVYMRAEPISLLSHAYLNHAHNDWVEFILEGGLAAAFILGAFLVWYLRAVLQVVRAKATEFDVEAFVAAVIIMAYGVASIVDYPLRVPIMAAVFAIACGQLALRRRGS